MKLTVKYGEMVVGRLSEQPSTGTVFFQYDPEWIRNGIELSPFHLPLSVSRAVSHPRHEFGGLHGLFWDSLPDSWGHLLLDERLKKAGLAPEKIGPLVRLSYLGERTMGKLTYHPQAGALESDALIEKLDLIKSDKAAERIMQGEGISDASEALSFLVAGSSVGGAKPKVTVNYDPATMTIGAGPGHRPWLVKLSAYPSSHKDSSQKGLVEYVYSIMARKSGIHMSPTDLIRAKTDAGKARWFFATRRFDRGENAARFHVHSYAALLQRPPDSPFHSYEELAEVTVSLARNMQVKDQIFRRCVFNVLAENCDDHAKNFAFLMDEKGRWNLSPAYDLTFSPGHNRQSVHRLSVNGNVRPDRDDILHFADDLGIDDPQSILAEVGAAVGQWKEIAADVGMRQANISKIKEIIDDNFRLVLEGSIKP